MTTLVFEPPLPPSPFTVRPSGTVCAKPVAKQPTLPRPKTPESLDVFFTKMLHRSVPPPKKAHHTTTTNCEGRRKRRKKKRKEEEVGGRGCSSVCFPARSCITSFPVSGDWETTTTTWGRVTRARHWIPDEILDYIPSARVIIRSRFRFPVDKMKFRVSAPTPPTTSSSPNSLASYSLCDPPDSHPSIIQ